MDLRERFDHVAKLAPVIRNSKGEKVILNNRERRHVNWLANQMYGKFGPRSEKLSNSLGYEVQITTLTTIMKRINA